MDQAMTTNQTPEQQIDDVRRTRLAVSGAIIALINADKADIEEGKRLTAAVADAITAYGDARFAAGRREALELLPCYDSSNCGLDRYQRPPWLCPKHEALATPTETKPTDDGRCHNYAAYDPPNGCMQLRGHEGNCGAETKPTEETE